MPERSLEDFVESVGGESHLRVEHDFGDGFVRLRTSEAERRQAAQDIRNTEGIVLELLRNARDAHASKVFLAMSRAEEKRLLTIIDDGDGIPAEMHEHVFEPRVTSKLDTNHMDAWGMHGRGMALYSIRVNSTESRVVSSAPGLGCSIHIETDTRKLAERTDQSSFPTFEMGEGGNVNVRGPRNILRTACEFAIETRDSCAVYIGSPLEIAATLHAYGASTLSAIDRVFCKDRTQLPLVKRLATAADPAMFAEIAGELGLAISERSARRVLGGEIPEAQQVLARIAIKGSGALERNSYGKGAPYADMRGFKLGKDDAALIAATLKEVFSEIAPRYFLESDVEPSVRASRSRIVVSIPVVKLD